MTIVKFVADPYNQLPVIIYWLMGSLAVLTACGRGLDGLSMGDDEARTLGVPVGLLRYSVIGATTLICALAVSTAGMKSNSPCHQLHALLFGGVTPGEPAARNCPPRVARPMRAWADGSSCALFQWLAVAGVDQLQPRSTPCL
ncbi:iron chelate uptake ABC transporter family permease subunit [Methylocella silvestris]|uniref:iron chelate uptake ABC transporter family permease subunit n=1 Tax=Methylocella silvestris TaxID=199596 RepID=UPI0031383517